MAEAIASSMKSREVVDEHFAGEKKVKVIFVIGGPCSGKRIQSTRIAEYYGVTFLSTKDLESTDIPTMLQKDQVFPSEVSVKRLRRAMQESANDKFVINGFPGNEEERAVYENIGKRYDGIETIEKRVKAFMQDILSVIQYYSSKGNLREIDGTKSTDEVFESMKAIMSELHEKDKVCLIAAKIYVSETLSSEVLQILKNTAKEEPECVLINIFKDDQYNRVRYTAVSKVTYDSMGPHSLSLQDMILSLLKKCYALISLDKHKGTHPRVGVVDDISFHPLGHASLQELSAIANRIADKIAAICEAPIFLCEAAHIKGNPLREVRWSIDYYKSTENNNWFQSFNSSSEISPDLGPRFADPSKGLLTVSATRWLLTYNIPLESENVTLTRSIAGQVRERGGRLQGVKALGLRHGDHTEIACMLFSPEEVGPDTVYHEVQKRASEGDVAVKKGYLTDDWAHVIVQKYLEALRTKTDT